MHYTHSNSHWHRFHHTIRTAATIDRTPFLRSECVIRRRWGSVYSMCNGIVKRLQPVLHLQRSLGLQHQHPDRGGHLEREVSLCVMHFRGLWVGDHMTGHMVNSLTSDKWLCRTTGIDDHVRQEVMSHIRVEMIT